MNEIIVLLLILGSLYGYDLPPKSDIKKMKHEEKIQLYERNKINTIESFSNRDVGFYSREGLKITYIGLAISFTPFITSLLIGKSNQIIVNFGILTNYVTIGLLINKIQKQKKIYNQNLYKEIFTSN